MNSSEQLDPENRNISKNKEEKKNPKPPPPPKKIQKKKMHKKKYKKPQRTNMKKKLKKRRFICYKAKVLKSYNECSKTNATRNKQIPKSRSLKYKHMY